jgi:hypothetical protein
MILSNRITYYSSDLVQMSSIAPSITYGKESSSNGGGSNCKKNDDTEGGTSGFARIALEEDIGKLGSHNGCGLLRDGRQGAGKGIGVRIPVNAELAA